MAGGPLYGDARSLAAFDDQGDAVAVAGVWSAGPERPGLIEPMGVHRSHLARGYGTAITLDAIIVILSTTEPIADTYWHQIQDTASPFLVVVSLDSQLGTSATGGRHITYLGAYVSAGDHQMALSDDELRERWLAELHRVLPRFRASTVRESHVFRFRNAQHVVDVDFASRIPDCQTPLEGYYLANFAQVFPKDRETNYAVRDGRAAAALILQHLMEREAPGAHRLRPAHPKT